MLLDLCRAEELLAEARANAIACVAYVGDADVGAADDFDQLFRAFSRVAAKLHEATTDDSR